MGDEVMEDVSVTIKDAVKGVASNDIHDFIDRTDLVEILCFSQQLQLLRDAETQSIDLVEEMGEGSELEYCNLGTHIGGFLNFELPSETEGDHNNFYIREGYDPLLDSIQEWWSKGKTRLVLIGNSGTGKSWYQIYVLRELLRGEKNTKEFCFVVRQVGPNIYLIDLENCKIYQWTPGRLNVAMKLIVDRMKRTMYLFEPGEEGIIFPMPLHSVPSLSTLSPFVGRIQQYKGSRKYKELYFWPWSFSQMNVVARTSFPELNQDHVLKCHRYFGGILRHVVDDDFANRKKELMSRLGNVKLSVLLNKYHEIDRDESGNSVSGYILCYDGYDRNLKVFDKKSLEYTSAYVMDHVEEVIHKRSLSEKVDTVLRRLDDEFVDLSGKNLEAAGTELLRRGSEIEWVCKRIGTGEDYQTYAMTKRTVTRMWDVDQKLRQPKHLLVSTNNNFPLADIVFSQPDETAAHDVIQFTWQKSHPFTVRALYDLRVNRLGVGDSVTVNVYVICPKSENVYGAMNKTDFLSKKSSLDKPFRWSRDQVAKQPHELKQMFENIHLFVLKPKKEWNEVLNHIRIVK